MKLSEVLRRFDAYPRTQAERTPSGATVTILSTMLVILLTVKEFTEYIKPEMSEDLFVDTTRGQKLRINLNITVARIACDYLSLDAMDSSGDQHLQIEHNVFKKRVDLNGNVIQDEPTKEIIASAVTAKDKNNTCGSCYGAQHNDTHCCNTCEDVIAAYRVKKWNIQIENIEQCKSSLGKHKKSEMDAFKEGCNIYGHFEVNRMAGNFHIAPGSSFTIDHFHIHDFHTTDFKLTHTINHLSFGEQIEFANTHHPLDGLHVEVKEASKGQMYSYYIKIVPTMYIKRDGEQIHTNQFSVTRHKKELQSKIERGMPGLFFHYELSPLMVKYEEKERSFGHFAANVCCIIGGVFTVAGFIVSLLHKSLDIIKIELNKIS